MSALPIAANLPSSMYAPLVLLLVGYAVLGVMATRARAVDDNARAERLTGIAFVLVLLAAVYTVVLLISAIVGYWQRVYDMVIILFVILVFFGLLLFLFFLIAELIPRALKRGEDH
jgi:hypothetical protein